MKMLSKYNDFILEQALSMMNESEVVYSQKFKKLLKDIESPIAKFLVDLESKDFDVASNFFDISDNKDTITFISDRKAQEFVKDTKDKFVKHRTGRILTHSDANKNIFELLGYTPEGSSGHSFEDGEIGEVVSKAVSPSSGRTYLYVKFPDGGKCVINQEHVDYVQNQDVWTKNRQSIRTGRGVRALLNASGQKFTDAEIEDFVNKYKSAFDRMNDIFRNFELVSGDQIGFWYSSKNYLNGTNRGTLGNSCMANVSVSYFGIYTNNPEVCNLLILRSADNNDKIVGRALVWKLTEPSGITFMDRIYTQEESDVQLFRDYAKSKGWYYKKRNDSSSEATAISPDGSEKNFNEFKVEIKSLSYGSFPYVDTIKYLQDDRKPYYLTTDEDSSYKCLESTSGGYEGGGCDRCGGDGRVECPDCDGSGEYECYECNGRGIEECDDCDGDGKVTCDDCDGEGTIDGEECSNCSGEGQVDCDGCDGKGKRDCSYCDGDGVRECGNCEGNGRVDCPECNW